MVKSITCQKIELLELTQPNRQLELLLCLTFYCFSKNPRLYKLQRMLNLVCLILISETLRFLLSYLRRKVSHTSN